tara:strand:- start:248 stop:820 length:573 start_codon:yes stop_codon:yes gene_type:complete
MNKEEELINNIYNFQCHKKSDYYNKTTFTSKIGSSIYGEITPYGVESILKKFNKYFNEESVFYDLGCGLGKMVFHMGIKTNIKKICGIEYSKERYQGCMDIQEQHGSSLNNISFINDSFFNIDINDGTIFYMDNTAMISKPFLSSVYNIFPSGALILHQVPFSEQDSFILNGEYPFTTYGSRNMRYFIKN